MLIETTIDTETVARKDEIMDVRQSTKSWSMVLKEISFHPDFGRFINKLFDLEEKVGYFSVSYDYGCYFPNAKLNLKFSNGIMPIRPGLRLDLGGKGRIVFPEKKVKETLNVGMFFFHSKMNEHEFYCFQKVIEKIIDESELYAEIDRICKNNETPKVERLEKMKDLLFFEFECAINNSNSKHINSFNWNYDVKEEWSFFGSEQDEKSKIGVLLDKICY